MKAQIRSFVRLFTLCFVFGTALAFADSHSILSAADDQAYREARTSWQTLADANAEIGLPPMGEEPKRADFAGVAAAQRTARAETRAQAENAEREWRQKIEAARPTLRTLRRPQDKSPNDYRSIVAREEKEGLLSVADERWARQDEVERELDGIAARLGVERRRKIGEGRYLILAGEIDGEPIWVGSHNQVAAASISADELWPTNLTPWPSASTGLGLTGTNITLGMWEAEGYTRESHDEFQGRVVQMDRTNNTTHFHATGVAGTMAAGGIIDLGGDMGYAMRGVAFEANVDAFDIQRFNSELPDAVAGGPNEPGLRLSNHSWGLNNGWSRRSFAYYDANSNLVVVIGGWVWGGPLSTTAWDGRTLYDLYKEAYTPWEWHPGLKRAAEECGIELFSTPFDETAVDFLEELGVARHKVASFELVDIPLLRKIGSTRKPVIMSTGMASEKEIGEAVDALRTAGCRELTLLKCTSSYPAETGDANLLTIPDMEKKFGCPVGISDHTVGIAVPVASVGLGICAIEKHFTLSRADGGPDSSFSLEPAEFKEMADAVRRAEQAMGSICYGGTVAETKTKIFRRSLFAVKDIKAGEIFTHENIRSIRPGYGLPPRELDNIIGKPAAANIVRGTPLAFNLVQG